MAFNELIYVLPLEVRTGTTTSANQVNNGFKGVKLHMYVETLPSGTLGLNLSGVERYSNQEYYLLSSSPISTSGVYTLTVYPGVTVQNNLALSTVLPFDWRVVVVHTPPDLIAKYAISASMYE